MPLLSLLHQEIDGWSNATHDRMMNYWALLLLLLLLL